jgi:GNAT superfamily N-acetyltransferase
MIRQAKREDAQKLAVLLRSLPEDLPRFGLEPLEATVKQVSEALRAGGDATTLLVAEEAGEISGFVHTHWQPSVLHSGGEGFVSALFIHPGHRGRGVGQALLTRVQAEGRRRGCSRLLLLNMRDRASYTRGFYAKLGWRERPDAANFVFDLKGKAS